MIIAVESTTGTPEAQRLQKRNASEESGMTWSKVAKFVGRALVAFGGCFALGIGLGYLSAKIVTILSATRIPTAVMTGLELGLIGASAVAGFALAFFAMKIAVVAVVIGIALPIAAAIQFASYLNFAWNDLTHS